MAKKRFLFGMLIIVTIFAMTACSKSAGGTLIITDIPSRFNGKYVFLESDGVVNNSYDFLVGAGSFKLPDFTGKLPRISNGRVSVPMWIVIDDEREIARYNGNHTIRVSVMIYEKEELKDDLDYYNDDIAEILLNYISFTNGSAAVSFQDHYEIWE